MTSNSSFDSFSDTSSGDPLNSSFLVSHKDALYDAIDSAVGMLKKKGLPLSRATSASSMDSSFSCREFLDLFEAELERVQHYVLVQQESQELTAKAFLQNTDHLVHSRSDPSNVVESLRGTAKELILANLELDAFVASNKRILQAVASYADDNLKTSCVQMLDRKFATAPWKGPTSALVVVLSDIYDVIRHVEQKQQGSPELKKWEAPSSFQRSTTKYWVEDSRLLELLLTCVKEVPLLVYGQSGHLTGKGDYEIVEGDKLWNSLVTPISSVYFDSPKMALYKDRLPRHEGAQLLRVRWYGEKPKGTDIVFLELKTHHEEWINASSVKERVNIQEHHMARILDKKTAMHANEAKELLLAATPSMEGDELENATNLLLQMRQLVVDKDLRPCVRSVYNRAAFQSPSSNALRLTIDRNITLIDESKAPKGAWCLPDDAIVDPSEVARVPFSVFEVKLSDAPMPPSIQTLLDGGVILEAAKFSKFLTGAASFNPVDTLPYWAEHPLFAQMFAGPNCSVRASCNQSSQEQALQQRCRSSRRILQGSFNTINGRRVNAKRKGASALNVEPSFFTVSTCRSSSDSGTDFELEPPTKQKLGLFVCFAGLRNTTSSRRSPQIANKKPARVEPKSYFANERTFIQWISAALMMITISAILIEQDSGSGSYLNFTGIALSVGALLVVFYSIFVYFRRLNLLSSGQPYGYIDYAGPVLLACAVGFGIIVLLVHKKSTTMFFSDGNSASVHSIQTERGHCFLHSNQGLNALQYQPSDIAIDKKKGLLLVSSLQSIVGHSIVDSQGADARSLIEIPDADLEGLVFAGNRLFALSEAGNRLNSTELLEFAWYENKLQVLHRWSLNIGKTAGGQAEAIAYVEGPGNTRSLYIDTEYGIGVFDLPSFFIERQYSSSSEGTTEARSPPSDPTPSGPSSQPEEDNHALHIDTTTGAVDYVPPPTSRSGRNAAQPDELVVRSFLNRHTLENGLAGDPKVGAMYYFEGILYILHDNARVIRAWEIESGTLLAEMSLPRVGNGSNNQWEGLAIERNNGNIIPGSTNNLRGGPSLMSNLVVHLALDSPPQVWSFAANEGTSRGSFVFPSCAAAT